jgi:hypothetical protein
MDETHAKIERNILEQTIRLDNYVGNVRTQNLSPLTYEIRWRQALRIEHEFSQFSYSPSLWAKFTLSKISERLHLVIAGVGGAETDVQSLPRDPGNPGFDRTSPTTHFVNTELRYELVQKPLFHMFLGAGFQIKLPLEAFARSRLEYTKPLSNVFLIRLAETFFVKNTDLLGETTEVTLDRALNPETIIRWASSGTASEEIFGIEWASELSLIRQLSNRGAINLTGGIYGNTYFTGMIQNYRLFARYRRNFYRSWLFYELEPEVSWPRNADGSYTATFAVTLRLEIVFKGAAERGAKASGTTAPQRPELPRGNGAPQN